MSGVKDAGMPASSWLSQNPIAFIGFFFFLFNALREYNLHGESAKIIKYVA